MSGKLMPGSIALIVLCVVQAAGAASSSVVISQIYGGGGSIGAPYKYDFIELHNKGASAVSLSGWTIQYADGNSNNWQSTALGFTLQPGQYFLIQQAGGIVGADLPLPDATSSISLGTSSGKVALVSSFGLLSGTCPTGGQIVDLVGYGPANCSEGSPTAAPGNATAVLRGSSGCTDTDNNAADFTVATPTPRNRGSTLVACQLPAPRFTAWNRAPNGTFTFQFTADPARSNVVQFSSNLTTWSTLTTALSQAGNIFSGADTNPAVRKLYRVWSP